MRIEVAISVPERLLVALERIGLALVSGVQGGAEVSQAGAMAPAAAQEVGHVSEPDHSNQCEPARGATEVAAIEQFAPAEDLEEQNRQGGGSAALATGAPGPSPADAAGPLPQVPSLPVPAVVPAAAMPVPGKEWRTPAREARVRELWPRRHMSMQAIWEEVRRMPGPPAPTSGANLTFWSRRLDLGPRGAMPAGRDPSAAEVEEAAAVAALPAGEMRETPQLKRARELLAMGMHPNDIKAAVKLSATEFQAVQREHGNV